METHTVQEDKEVGSFSCQWMAFFLLGLSLSSFFPVEQYPHNSSDSGWLFQHDSKYRQADRTMEQNQWPRRAIISLSFLPAHHTVCFKSWGESVVFIHIMCCWCFQGNPDCSAFQKSPSQSSRWKCFGHSDSQQHKVSLRATSEPQGRGATHIQCLYPVSASSSWPSRGHNLRCVTHPPTPQDMTGSFPFPYSFSIILNVLRGWPHSRCLCLKICKHSS